MKVLNNSLIWLQSNSTNKLIKEDQVLIITTTKGLKMTVFNW